MRMLTLVVGATLCCVVLSPAPSDGSVAAERDPKARSPQAVVETVAETEKRLKKLVNSGFKVALPYLMTVVTEIRMSTSCLQGLLMLVRGVKDIKDWAIKMIDALGKPSAGILEGTATAMGDYDECLNIVAPRRTRPPAVPPYTPKQIAFHGQYCVVQIHIPEGIRQAAMAYQAGNRSNSELANTKSFLRNLVKIAPRADVADLRLGVCIPSICNKQDLQLIVNEIAHMVNFAATAVRCETKSEKKFEVEQIVILSGILILSLIILMGTLAEVVIRFRDEEPFNDTTLARKSMVVQSIVAFSIYRNTQKMLSMTPNDSPKISCLRGMKFISICLYIVVWTYATPQDFHFLKYRSAFYFHQFMEEWWFTVFANASAGVDTLFLIAGVHVAYRQWWKHGGGKRISSIPKFILKWFLRFALAQAIVICIFLLMSHFGNGPMWGDIVTPVINNCRERWWLNVLGINNFWPTDTTCLPHTWLVCCLFHMLLIAPILMFLLSKCMSLGIFVNIALITGSSIAIAMVTLMNAFPPAPAFYFLSFINIKAIWQKLFIQAYDHIAPFCIGILLGFFMGRYEKVKLNKVTVIVMWCLAVTCCLAVMCGLYGYRHGESMEISLSAVYASIHRIVWSLGIAWVIFACAYGYGGFVNEILSWKFLIVFERLSNATYLLHPVIVYLHEGQLRERMYMAHLDQAMYATAYIVFTIGIAALCYVSCFAPFMHFEKKLWYYEAKINEADPPAKKLKEHSIVTSIEISKDKDDFLHPETTSVPFAQKLNKYITT